MDVMELQKTGFDVTCLRRDINKQLRAENGGVA
jgi:hypothetical protein